MSRFRPRHLLSGNLIALSGGLLALISIIAMCSAAMSVNPQLPIRHIFWIGVGIMVFFAVSRTRYTHWTEVASLFYILSVGLLGLVLLVGAMRLGATRWLSLFGISFQPSELAKLAIILVLAHYLSGQSRPLSLRSFVISGLIVSVPTFLIFIQPDLGSSSILVAIWLGMIWVAGIPRWVLVSMMSLGVAMLPVGWFFLKEYQRSRVLVFVDPYADPLGAGFSIIQSRIAIGSGGLLGRGWKAGTQSQLNFLPEHHSDFIFSVIGEEWGFVGCVVLIAAFGFLMIQMLRVARESLEPQGRLLAVGVFSWITYQAFVNMAMVIGLLPVVGVPLPMISYGGSSMVMIWTALGLVQSVRRTMR